MITMADYEEKVNEIISYTISVLYAIGIENVAIVLEVDGGAYTFTSAKTAPQCFIALANAMANESRRVFKAINTIATE